MGNVKGAAAGALIFAGAAAAGFGPAPAQAANITFAVIGPHEYELPVNFDPFNVFVQYGLQNYASQAYDNSGGLVRGSKQSLFVGLSKYVYFWTSRRFPTSASPTNSSLLRSGSPALARARAFAASATR